MPESLEYQTDAQRKWLGRNYDRAVWFYEKSAKLYSGDQIAASKRYQLNHIRPGDKTIFLGVGSGEDALMAAEHGADVTCVDISPGMLAAVEGKLKAKNLSARLICKSAYDFSELDTFDVCCANYFLNVFKKPDMIRMLRHATKLVRVGGKFMIADVALPQGSTIQRAVNTAYRKFAMYSFWAMGLVPIHQDYDYVSYLSDTEVDFEEVEYFRLFDNGPIVYQCIVGIRNPV